MMSTVDSKVFIKFDVLILVATVGFFAINQMSINKTYSSGYSGIWTFFLVESIIQMTFQLLLMLSDQKNSKFWVLSLRSGSFFYMLGMSIILIFLGLFSIWLIVYISICGYFQITMFLKGLNMSNDVEQPAIARNELMERLMGGQQRTGSDEARQARIAQF